MFPPRDLPSPTAVAFATQSQQRQKAARWSINCSCCKASSRILGRVGSIFRHWEQRISLTSSTPTPPGGCNTLQSHWLRLRLSSYSWKANCRRVKNRVHFRTQMYCRFNGKYCEQSVYWGTQSLPNSNLAQALGVGFTGSCEMLAKEIYILIA